MDGKIDKVREAEIVAAYESWDGNKESIAEIVEDAGDYLFEIGATQDPRRYDEIEGAIAFRAGYLAALSAVDPEAIKREFWDELHAEAEMQYDRRLNLLGPIETLDDAAFRKTLGDGWSAWLLAKKIIENRRSAILSAEPAQDDGKPEVVAFEEIKDWLISKSGQYKSEYIQASIVMLRNMFDERAAEVKRRIEEAKG